MVLLFLSLLWLSSYCRWLCLCVVVVFSAVALAQLILPLVVSLCCSCCFCGCYGSAHTSVGCSSTLLFFLPLLCTFISPLFLEVDHLPCSVTMQMFYSRYAKSMYDTRAAQATFISSKQRTILFYHLASTVIFNGSSFIVAAVCAVTQMMLLEVLSLSFAIATLANEMK